MRRDLVFNQGTAEEARFRVTATRVRREVIVDAPVQVDCYSGQHYRMRFALAEAEAFLALILEAVATARK